MKYLVLSVALAVSSVAPNVSFAQTARFDSAQLTAACLAAPAQCKTLVEQLIVQLKALGLTEKELNSQLGSIAVAVVSAAQQAGPGSTGAAALGAALTTVAEESTNENQAGTIRTAASNVSGGGTGGSSGLDGFGTGTDGSSPG